MKKAKNKVPKISLMRKELKELATYEINDLSEKEIIAEVKKKEEYLRHKLFDLMRNTSDCEDEVEDYREKLQDMGLKKLIKEAGEYLFL